MHITRASILATVLSGCLVLQAVQAAPDGSAWVTVAVPAPHVQFRTFESAAARAPVSYHVYAPEAYDREPDRRFPVLYWLHGSGGGLAGVAQLAERFDMAIRTGKAPPMLVVFPNGQELSLWVDARDGTTPVETVVVRDLIPHVDASWRTVASREGRLVEGFSMGGYGAARFGLKYNELFGAVSMLAGGPLQRDFTHAPRVGPHGREEVLARVFGGDMEWFRAQSPWMLAEQNAGAVRGRTPMRLAIGERDETLPANREFDARLTRLGIPHTFAVLPGVGHNPVAVLDAMGEAQWSFYREAFCQERLQPRTTPVYDPLVVATPLSEDWLDLDVRDAARQRDIPVRVYLPAAAAPAPVVLFSHGLGGSREGSAFLGRHWAARGYVAVFLQHPGSDDSVWRGKPVGERMAAMDGAADGPNFLRRVQDVHAVLDQLATWQAEAGHALCGRLDLARVGMSGHSFGAVTTQAVSGQGFVGGRDLFTDGRIRAALVLSPSSPRLGDPARAFGGVGIPWLLMTGTRDVAPIGHADVASRLAVFPALSAGDKYELVLHEAEHSVFTDRPLPGESGRRNPNHHRVILALSTAFWDAYLRQDPAAAAWLQGDGPRRLLEAPDRWQRK